MYTTTVQPKNCRFVFIWLDSSGAHVCVQAVDDADGSSCNSVIPTGFRLSGGEGTVKGLAGAFALFWSSRMDGWLQTYPYCGAEVCIARQTSSRTPKPVLHVVLD